MFNTENSQNKNVRVPLGIFSKKYLKQEIDDYTNNAHVMLKHEKLLYNKGDVKVIARNPLAKRIQSIKESNSLFIDLNTHIQSYLYIERIFNFITPVLLIKNEPIMSITPLEVESQYLPIELAKGDVAILGLGLGYYLQKIQNKPEVKKVKVYEINKNVVDFYANTFEIPSNVEIILQNAKDMEDEKFDFVFNDIYSSALSFDFMVKDFVKLSANNRFENYFAWTQEALLFGLILESEALHNNVLEFEMMKPFKRWLLQGYPFIQTFYKFLFSRVSNPDFEFQTINISYKEFPEFLKEFPKEMWNSLY